MGKHHATEDEKILEILAKTRRNGECREWQGSRLTRGTKSASTWTYPYIDFRRKRWRGHRLLFTLANGPIPKGKYVLHWCGNSLCLNLDHLYLGDAKQNAHDTIRHGRNPKLRKTHCPKGHPLSGENLRIDKYGYRNCRTCQKWRKVRNG